MNVAVPSLRIAVTADLHYGTRHPAGNLAIHALVASLVENTPDLLIIAGDIGAGDDFERCLAMFDGLSCQKALVPGNHDIWSRIDDVRGNSLDLYDSYLPDVSARHGFVYLDRGPLILNDHGLAIVGNMNWYDYTWDIDRLRQAAVDWEERLRTKRFTRGMHNDANFVHWPYTDVTFTDRVVQKLTEDLTHSLTQVDQAVVVTHHPPVMGLLYPCAEPPPLDALLWRAFSGNVRVERLIEQHVGCIPFVFCGHTHWARECELSTMHGINVGGDYHFKRLVRIEWPSREVRFEEFH